MVSWIEVLAGDFGGKWRYFEEERELRAPGETFGDVMMEMLGLECATRQEWTIYMCNLTRQPHIVGMAGVVNNSRLHHL